MPQLSEGAKIQLIDLAVTIAASEVPRLIAFFRTLGAAGQMTAEQILMKLEQADAIDEAVIAAARKALREAGVDPAHGVGS